MAKGRSEEMDSASDSFVPETFCIVLILDIPTVRDAIL